MHVFIAPVKCQRLVKVRVALVVPLTIGFLSSTFVVLPATAQVVVAPTGPTVEQAIPWKRPEGTPVRVRRTARSVRITMARGPACSGLDRIERRRTRKAIVITPVFAVIQPIEIPVFPYYSPFSCPPPPLPVTKRVSLRGRLGTRVIKDGATAPPKVRYRPKKIRRL